MTLLHRSDECGHSHARSVARYLHGNGGYMPPDHLCPHKLRLHLRLRSTILNFVLFFIYDYTSIVLHSRVFIFIHNDIDFWFILVIVDSKLSVELVQIFFHIKNTISKF